jgi:hypothetical protein
MMEAVHVGSAMMAGIVLAHSTQMRKIIKKLRKCNRGGFVVSELNSLQGHQP